jgi:hypothetical protein
MEYFAVRWEGVHHHPLSNELGRYAFVVQVTDAVDEQERGEYGRVAGT